MPSDALREHRAVRSPQGRLSITIGSLLIAEGLWVKDRAVLWNYIWPCWLLAGLSLVRYISLRRKAVARAYIYFDLRGQPKAQAAAAE